MNFPFSHHLAMCAKLCVFLSILMQMCDTSQFQYIVSAQFFYYDPVVFYFILIFETGSHCVD